MFALATTAAYAAETGPSNLVLLIILLSIPGLLLYFIPTFVAVSKKHRDKTAIILLNIFLGWSFIAWVIALVWAVKKTHPQNIYYVSNSNQEISNDPDQNNK